MKSASKKISQRSARVDLLIIIKLGGGRQVRSTEWRYQNFDRNRYRDFFYDTKFSETETETFFGDQIFLKLKPILFFRNQDFFPRPNFSETETFFPRPNFSKPKPKPPEIWQKSRDRDLNRDFSTSLK